MGQSSLFSVKKVNKKNIIENISFDLFKGELIGFLGPNGAGKSTTLKVCAQVLMPDSGQVYFKNDPLNFFNSIEFKKKLSYSPETPFFYSEMKVIEFIDFSKSFNQNTQEESYESLVRDFKINNILNKKMNSLSKGELQKVHLITSLINTSEILILDEPTNALDPEQVSIFKEHLKRIKKKTSILYSTHRLDEVFDLADRVFIFNEGKIVNILDSLPNHLEDMENIYLDSIG